MYRFSLISGILVAAILASGCVESSSLSPESAGSPTKPAAVANQEQSAPTPQPAEKLTKHDAALRFLTAYIHLDREMALRYATPKAVSKLDWNRPHRGNIPYYDDKMFLYYSGGLAKVYFQEINGSYMISDFQTHRR